MKKKILNFIAGLFLVLLLGSCSVEPQAIDYGTDACNYCKMNIVDKQHGAELVTKKGKVYKFDAVECLLNDLKERDPNEIGLLLVNTFDSPKELNNVESATFLISENIPSPMGAFLTAFSSKEIAHKESIVNGGELYNWNQLKEKFTKE